MGVFFSFFHVVFKSVQYHFHISFIFSVNVFIFYCNFVFIEVFALIYMYHFLYYSTFTFCLFSVVSWNVSHSIFYFENLFATLSSILDSQLIWESGAACKIKPQCGIILNQEPPATHPPARHLFLTDPLYVYVWCPPPPIGTLFRKYVRCPPSGYTLFLCGVPPPI